MHLNSRRGFIAGGAALGALGLLGLSGCGDDGTTSSAATTEPSAPRPDLSPVPAPDAPPQDYITRVGEMYRAVVPEEDDKATLESLLPALAGLPAAEIVTQLPTLEPAVREDFAAGRTVELDGWILAVTEGRASALISLS